jgi:hypothetical protein
MLVDICQSNWQDTIGTLSFTDDSWYNNFVGSNGLFAETGYENDVNENCKGAIGQALFNCRHNNAVWAVENIIEMSKNDPAKFSKELSSHHGLRFFECPSPSESRGFAPAVGNVDTNSLFSDLTKIALDTQNFLIKGQNDLEKSLSEISESIKISNLNNIKHLALNCHINSGGQKKIEECLVLAVTLDNSLQLVNSDRE